MAERIVFPLWWRRCWPMPPALAGPPENGRSEAVATPELSPSRASGLIWPHETPLRHRPPWAPCQVPPGS